jgi:hypothetical protein
MLFAVTPQQAADLPDIVARTTMWAAVNLAPPLSGKLPLTVIGLSSGFIPRGFV